MMSINRRELMKAGVGAAAVSLTGTGLNELSAALKQGRKDSPINLLFIMTDQQRWDALSRAGNPVLDTPNLDRLSREGVYFENAMSQCPVCVPARASMLTGCSTHTTGIRFNPDFDREGFCQMPTFDNILAQRGYWTEYYGKWHSPVWRALDYKNQVTEAGIARTILGPGLEHHYWAYLDKHVPKRDLKQGERLDIFSLRPFIPDPLDIGYGLGPNEQPLGEDGKPHKIVQPDLYGCLLLPAKHQPTALYSRETMDALERCKDKAFSITCSIHHPHSPMLPTKPYYGMYPARQMPIPRSIDDPMDNSPYQETAKHMKRYRDKEKIGYMISCYYGLVKEIDDHVGLILKKLKDLGLENNTLVIFTSDHGEMLGSHGMREKNVFYNESVHVPLIMRFPGTIPANAVVSEPVSQINLFATILDYLGAPAHSSQGRSMRRLIEGRDKSSFEYAVCEFNSDAIPHYMVQTDEWKFLFSRPTGRPKLDALYHLKDDPLEMNNLIGRNPQRSKWLQQAGQMKERLIEWLEKTGSPHLAGVKDRKIT